MPQLRDRLREAHIRQGWRSVVGAEAARRTQAVRFDEGTLTVHVDNSPWLSELTLRADEILARLRARFPDAQAVRFVLGTAAGTAPAADPPPAPRGRPLSRDDVEEIDEAVAPIADADARAAARRLLTAAWRSPHR
jgi:hypothetical protein